MPYKLIISETTKWNDQNENELLMSLDRPAKGAGQCCT